jgi:hypothetical protein
VVGPLRAQPGRLIAPPGESRRTDRRGCGDRWSR